MRVGVFGTGDVGQTLASAFVTLGHEVMLGARSKGGEKAVAWLASQPVRASEGAFEEVAEYGELLVLCTLGVANAAVLGQAGALRCAGKILIDTTNPLDMSTFPPSLAISGEDSSGEEVQRLVPETLVVKAFNTVGNRHMFRPEFPGGPPDMFICGNDPGAKATVGELLSRDFGWGVIDVGDIRSSRYLEAMCLVWVLHGAIGGTWDHAFKMLER